MNRFVSIIVAVDDRVDDHLLDRDGVVGADGPRNLSFQPKLEIHERQQIDKIVQLAPKISGDRAANDKLVGAIDRLELDIISKAAAKPVARPGCPEFNPRLRKVSRRVSRKEEPTSESRDSRRIDWSHQVQSVGHFRDPRGIDFSRPPKVGPVSILPKTRMKERLLET